MSTNCLVSKLKGQTNNSDLYKLGVFTIHVNEGTNLNVEGKQQLMRIRAIKPFTLKVADGTARLSTTFAGLSNPVDHIDIPVSQYGTSIYFANGTYDVEADKYAFNLIEVGVGVSATPIMGADAVLFNAVPLVIARLRYMHIINDANKMANETVTELALDNSDISGNLDLSKFPVLQSFSATFCNNLKINVDKMIGKNSALTTFIVFGPLVTGTLNVFSNKTNITRISISNTSITGDISSLIACTSLILLDAHGTAITGSIDAFVSGQVANGRTQVLSSNAINANNLLAVCTFGGITHSEPYCHLTWESASKIAIFAGNNNIASCTKVYTKGYTQEEAEAAFSGKTIIRVDA